jgi:hypothetical protein
MFFIKNKKNKYKNNYLDKAARLKLVGSGMAARSKLVGFVARLKSLGSSFVAHLKLLGLACRQTQSSWVWLGCQTKRLGSGFAAKPKFLKFGIIVRFKTLEIFFILLILFLHVKIKLLLTCYEERASMLVFFLI